MRFEVSSTIRLGIIVSIGFLLDRQRIGGQHIPIFVMSPIQDNPPRQV